MREHPVESTLRLALLCGLLFLASAALPVAQTTDAASSLDDRVRAFLARHRYAWRDMNVPEADGRTLHDLIVTHQFKRTLEIGTSTGHSAIWLAWALSKTDGRLITIEIDERRHRTALVNFKEAGLSAYIDARLGDAHELVPRLEGPFDFVFIDADKEGYKNYLVAVLPKLRVGGCITAHNVSGRRQFGIGAFLEYLESLPNLETTIDRTSPAGLSISCRRVDK